MSTAVTVIVLVPLNSGIDGATHADCAVHIPD
jgi:hypothetical protein